MMRTTILNVPKIKKKDSGEETPKAKKWVPIIKFMNPN
jgi:hypothetical protein